MFYRKSSVLLCHQESINNEARTKDIYTSIQIAFEHSHCYFHWPCKCWIDTRKLAIELKDKDLEVTKIGKFSFLQWHEWLEVEQDEKSYCPLCQIRQWVKDAAWADETSSRGSENGTRVFRIIYESYCRNGMARKMTWEEEQLQISQHRQPELAPFVQAGEKDRDFTSRKCP